MMVFPDIDLLLAHFFTLSLVSPQTHTQMATTIMRRLPNDIIAVVSDVNDVTVISNNNMIISRKLSQ